MPLVQTRGAASAQGFGEFAQAASAAVNYIEDVFSTYLYTGTGAALTITNNIDLSTKGGLTWIKGRSGATGHRLTDTARGVTKSLESNSTAAEATESTGLTAFGTTGFTIGADADYNTSAATYASWTFRKQPKFFDIVTWTGTGSTGAISHSHALGSTPGCIIIKAVSTNEGHWYVYHRSLGVGQVIALNLTAASSNASSPDAWTVSSTQFSVNTSQIGGNTNGTTYIAYLFAHDAGGFGLTGSDNVISCGSFTVSAGGTASVTLGYEPQWVMVKASSRVLDWTIQDTMRGMYGTTALSPKDLYPNLSSAEANGNQAPINATGFTWSGYANETFIYIAIRRGPMKVPTVGTTVYNGVSRTGTDANATISSIGFPPDTLITKNRSGTASPIGAGWLDRLRGLNNFLITDGGSAEDTVQTDILRSWNMNGVTLGPDANTSRFNWSANTYMNWFFGRAPSFFDIVCYTGTGSNTTQAHNLTTVPELIFVKRRNASGSWQVYSSALANTEYLVLDSTAAKATGATRWNSTTPTSSVFSLGTDATVNASGGTYVAYLFATAPGVSKVGSYTGTGTTQTINCGFTAGSRFVMIKRTDSTGDWYVWDSTRGIIAGNDPYLLLNSGIAEVTGTDYVDTANSGFELSSTAPAAINANGGSFIFLAIA